MRIKFGRMWGNALTSSHFEKKARRTTDLARSVNHVSRPICVDFFDVCDRIHDALDNVNCRRLQLALTVARERCARLVTPRPPADAVTRASRATLPAWHGAVNES
jgi:hypothetical protein